MGAITRAAANNFTTGGVILPAAINDASVASVTSLSQVAAGDNVTLIQAQTASGDATISFTTGINSTYDIYLFKYWNIHPSVDNPAFRFQASTNGGSSYGVTQTSSVMDCQKAEGGGGQSFGYQTGQDEAQTTNFQLLFDSTGFDNDQCGTGEIWLFNPSSTTQVKTWFSRNNRTNSNEYSIDSQMGGYFNTTTAINAIQFKFASGNIDLGTIALYGVG